MWKAQRSWGRVLAPNSRNKAKYAKHKILTFAPIIASVTLEAISLQINGMLRMSKIQQTMQDDVIQTARIHPAAGLNCSYGKISSLLTKISGTEPARPLPWYEHIEHFTKDLEVRWDLRNRVTRVHQYTDNKYWDGFSHVRILFLGLKITTPFATATQKINIELFLQNNAKLKSKYSICYRFRSKFLAN